MTLSRHIRWTDVIQLESMAATALFGFLLENGVDISISDIQACSFGSSDMKEKNPGQRPM